MNNQSFNKASYQRPDGEVSDITPGAMVNSSGQTTGIMRVRSNEVNSHLIRNSLGDHVIANNKHLISTRQANMGSNQQLNKQSSKNGLSSQDTAGTAGRGADYAMNSDENTNAFSVGSPVSGPENWPPVGNPQSSLDSAPRQSNTAYLNQRKNKVSKLYEKRKQHASLEKSKSGMSKAKVI